MEQPATVTAKHGRIDWLDGLRAYAIAGVVLVHSTRIGGVDPASTRFAEIGQYGVQLFFVISAATVYMTLRDTQRKGDPIGSWYLRRFLRIAPLYYAAIAGYLVLNLAKARLGAEPNPDAFDPLSILANLAFVHAWIPHSESVPGGWSIGVEMSFYLVAPALLWLLDRRAGLAVLLVITVALVAAVALLEPAVRNNSFRYFWPPTQFPVLLLGLAFVHATRGWLLTDQSTPRAWAFGGWTALIGGGSLGALLGAWGGLHPALAPTAFGIAGCGLVLLARSPLRAAFANQLAVWLGSISYSVYICHFAVIEVLAFTTHKVVAVPASPLALPIAFLVVLSIACGLAVLTKRYIEDPGIRLRRYLEPRRSPKTAQA